MPNKSNNNSSNKVVDLTTTTSSTAVTTILKNFNAQINNYSACTAVTDANTSAVAAETTFCPAVDDGSAIKYTTYSESPWNIIKMLELIEQFRQQPVLWDQNHPFYKNKLSRNKAWDNIADNMKMNKLDCEKKLNILRTQFRRECKRIKKEAMIMSSSSNVSANSSNFNHDAGAGNNTEPSWYKQHKASKWFAYRSMLFLADDETFKALEDKYGDDILSLKKRIDNNSSIDNIKEELNENNDCNETYDDNDDTTNDDTSEMQQSENYEESNLYIAPDEMVTSPNHNSTVTTSRTATITGIKRRRYDQDHDHHQQETIVMNNNNTTSSTAPYENYFHSLSQEKYDYHDKHLEHYFKQNQNECLSYGEHIGYRLMRLPQKTRCIVMNIINSTLFEADMGKFDNIIRHKNS